MAAKKAKKPTNKLKAGKKKKINKWLILGGVAAVAIIGAAVVRFSSAANWYVVARDGYFEIQRPFQALSGLGTRRVELRSNRNYRVCVTGYSLKGTSDLDMYFSTYPSRNNNKTIRQYVAKSTKRYGTTNQKHCSATFKTIKSYWVSGWFWNKSGGKFKLTDMTIDELR